MKIIALDFDGVLDIRGTFSKAACKNLNRLLDEVPEAKIVVSSSWRQHGLEFCKKLLQTHGIDSTRVVDITGNEVGSRGMQVKTWLQRHSEVTHYVILDDQQDFDSAQQDHFVKTLSYVGLTSADVTKSVDILNK